jgi:hypothetical protein
MMDLLITLPLLQVDVKAATGNSFQHELLLNSITGIFAFIGILLAALLAYFFAIRQKKKEIFIGLEKIKYERKLAAIEECWKLLAYLTETENDRAILIWGQVSSDKPKTYSINVENAKAYINGLSACFYGTGLGIYLSKETKELLFEYRGIIYSFLLGVIKRKETLINVDNDKMNKRMLEIHKELVLQMKKETENISNKD